MIAGKHSILGSDRLPYDSRIEYLEIAGDGAYIDTGIAPVDNPSGTIRAQYLGTALASAQTTPLFGARRWNPGAMFAFWVRSDTLKLAVNYGTVDTGWKNQTTDKTGFHDFGLSASGGTYDGSTFVSHGQTLSSGISFSLYIGACDQRGGGNDIETRGVKMRVSSFQLYNGGILVFDGYSVRAGAVAYLFDRVTRQLFGNAGSGAFVLGTDCAERERERESKWRWLLRKSLARRLPERRAA